MVESVCWQRLPCCCGLHSLVSRALDVLLDSFPGATTCPWGALWPWCVILIRRVTSTSWILVVELLRTWQIVFGIFQLTSLVWCGVPFLSCGPLRVQAVGLSWHPWSMWRPWMDLHLFRFYSHGVGCFCWHDTCQHRSLARAWATWCTARGCWKCPKDQISLLRLKIV